MIRQFFKKSLLICFALFSLSDLFYNFFSNQDVNLTAKEILVISDKKIANDLENNNKIEARVLYDSSIILPSHAMIVLELTVWDKKTAMKRVIAETRQPVTNSIIISFTLPMKLSELDETKSYHLQSKIIVGDSLWFVNENTTPIESGRSSYLIRLAKVEQGNLRTENLQNIIDKKWIADHLAQQKVLGHISLQLSKNTENEKDPVTGDLYHRVSGSAGCNQYFGRATLNQDEGKLYFAPIATTFIACENKIALQEMHFVETMTRVASYHIDSSGYLTFFDQSNLPLLRFHIE